MFPRPPREFPGSSRWRRFWRRSAVAGVATALVLTTLAPSAADASTAAKHSCHVYGALFTKFPFAASPKHGSGGAYYDFAQFTATRSGLYAGIIYRNASNEFYLITWRSGHAPTVLAHWQYRYAYAIPNAVNPVGITPNGTVVAALQNPAYRSGLIAFGSYRGTYWVGKHGHYLSHGSTWIAWAPTGVTNSGAIAGWAATGTPTHPHYYAVSWPSTTSKYHVLASVGTRTPTVVTDGAGDIAWTQADGYAVVHTTAGAIHELDVGSHAASLNVYPAGASSNSIYATGLKGLYGWRVSGRTLSGAVQGTHISSGNYTTMWVDTVGPRGDLVLGSGSPARLRSVTAGWQTMPSQALASPSRARVINTSGAVLYTSSRDRRVHVMTCH